VLFAFALLFAATQTFVRASTLQLRQPWSQYEAPVPDHRAVYFGDPISAVPWPEPTEPGAIGDPPEPLAMPLPPQPEALPLLPTSWSSVASGAPVPAPPSAPGVASDFRPAAIGAPVPALAAAPAMALQVSAAVSAGAVDPAMTVEPIGTHATHSGDNDDEGHTDNNGQTAPTLHAADLEHLVKVNRVQQTKVQMSLEQLYNDQAFGTDVDERTTLMEKRTHGVSLFATLGAMWKEMRKLHTTTYEDRLVRQRQKLVWRISKLQGLIGGEEVASTNQPTSRSSVKSPEIVAVPCIVILCVQYFLIHTASVVVIAASDFLDDRVGLNKNNTARVERNICLSGAGRCVTGIRRALEAASITTGYAPMLGALYLVVYEWASRACHEDAGRFGLPFALLDMGMEISTTCMLLLALLSMLVSCVKQSRWHTIPSLWPVSYNVLQAAYLIVLAVLNICTAMLCICLCVMQGVPQTARDISLSPAARCTVALTVIFLVVYLIAAAEESFRSALYSVEVAPVAAIVFLGIGTSLTPQVGSSVVDAQHLGGSGNHNTSHFPSWVPVMFYTCTAALFLETIAKIATTLRFRWEANARHEKSFDTVKLIIHGATGLSRLPPSSATSAYYCVCTVPGKPEICYQTATIAETEIVQWRETLQLSDYVVYQTGDRLDLSVFSMDKLPPYDELVGKATLDDSRCSFGFNGPLFLAPCPGWSTHATLQVSLSIWRHHGGMGQRSHILGILTVLRLAIVVCFIAGIASVTAWWAVVCWGMAGVALPCVLALAWLYMLVHTFWAVMRGIEDLRAQRTAAISRSLVLLHGAKRAVAFAVALMTLILATHVRLGEHLLSKATDPRLTAIAMVVAATAVVLEVGAELLAETQRCAMTLVRIFVAALKFICQSGLYTGVIVMIVAMCAA